MFGTQLDGPERQSHRRQLVREVRICRGSTTQPRPASDSHYCPLRLRFVNTLRPQRVKRSAGTMTPLDALRNWFRAPSGAAIAADLAAIDRGVSRRVACLFRGDYAGCPRHFHRKMADLRPQALVLRPFWSSPARRSFEVADLVVSASVRSRDRGKDRNVPGTGMYGPGRAFGYAGSEVVACQTELGRFELAVPRPDVPLVLHYLQTVRSRHPSTQR